jgi:predicted fused transcriptional regulator/phosphomethylpyrimidine kinase/predicted transcriptional regulator
VKFRAEVLAESVLPTIRVMLAKDLRDRGLTQRAVAEKLGLSQSAVSKYAQGDVETRAEVAEDDRVQALVADLGRGLAEDDVRPVGALIEIEELLADLSGPGDLVAELHAEAVPELRSIEYDVAAVDPDATALERERVRASVRRGLRILEGTSGLAALVPHVGSNLVEAIDGASAVEDVAGVPGRIIDVNGRLEVPDDPAFGVSESVGGVLLAAREAGSDARAALNLAFTEPVLEALAAEDHDPVEMDLGRRDLEASVEAAIDESPEATVLYHRGAIGVEPIVYVLGPSAVEVARTARAVTESIWR